MYYRRLLYRTHYVAVIRLNIVWLWFFINYLYFLLRLVWLISPRCLWGHWYFLLGLTQVLISAWIGIRMDPRVSSKFVWPTELLKTPRKWTTMGLLPSMRSYMSCLMFKSVECLVTHRTLVRPAGRVLTLVLGLCSHVYLSILLHFMLRWLLQLNFNECEYSTLTISYRLFSFYR